jgi:hypothetical protein
MNNEFEIVRKETDRAKFEALSQYLSRGTEEHRENIK